MGQGLGYCQGVFVCFSEIAGDDTLCNFLIYDSYCNKIAENDNPNVGDAIDSELPYTVDLIYLDDSYIQDQVAARWLYAGGEYGKGASGYFYGSCNSGLTACSYVRSSFPC